MEATPQRTDEHSAHAGRARAALVGLVVALGLTLGAGLAPSALADSTSETKTYAVGGGLTWVAVPVEDPLLIRSENCCHCPTQTFVGGAAFCADDTYAQVTVSIDDASGLATAGLVQVGDGDFQPFCEETTVPTNGAEEVSVFVGDVASPGPDCPGQGTTGEVTATWS